MRRPGSLWTVLAFLVVSMTLTFPLSGEAHSAENVVAGRVVYSGPAQVRVEYYDYCDLSSTNRRHYDSRSADMPVTLVINDPSQDSSGNREPNPFFFSLATDSQGEEGTFGLQSALAGKMEAGSGRDVLLVYWEIQYDEDTGEFSGELTDSHRKEAAASNLLFSQGNGQPCDVSSGVLALGDGKDNPDFRTVMKGRISDRTVQVHVEGISWNGNRDLVVDAELPLRQ